jgi:cytochrome c oxidase subunit 2
VRVVAEQFAWNVHYPGADHIFGKSDVSLVSSSNPLGLDVNDPHAKDDITTLNQLYLQVDRPVIVQISSKDVIHSFALPYMRVKQDAIPGMVVPVHFTATRTSGEETWEIACAQLCGLGHYRMRGQYHVQVAGFADTVSGHYFRISRNQSTAGLRKQRCLHAGSSTAKRRLPTAD